MKEANKKELLKHSTQCLVPPGNGVYTVHTGKERREKLHQTLYPNINEKDVTPEWEKQLENSIEASDTSFLFGVCSDSGGGILRGANWGPLYIRSTLWENSPTLMREKNIFDLGDVKVVPHFLHDKYLNKETIKKAHAALFGEEQINYPVSPLSLTEYYLDALRKHRRDLGQDTRLLALGGDHSVSYPLVKSYLHDAAQRNIKVGLIHFDAHTDLLTERLGVDICFGSWVPHILEGLPSPSCAHQVGIRSSGKDKNHWEKTFGVHQYWNADVQKQGVSPVVESIKQRLREEQIEEIYISFDIDALGSEFASATGTPEKDGLRPDQVSTMIRELTRDFPLGSADLVEVAPFIHHEDQSEVEPESTLMCASSISALLIEALQK